MQIFKKGELNTRRLLVAIGLSLALTACSTAPDKEAQVARGDYLVNGIVACGNCHTPRNDDGMLIADRHLAGAFQVERAEFTAYAPNITMDRETGIGAWSDDEIVRAIREGVRRDGTIIGPPMPIRAYRDISDSDVQAIVAYLRTAAPVKNSLPQSMYNIPLPESYGPAVSNVADVSRDDAVAYGAYLGIALGHCMECHTPMSRGIVDHSRIGAGGTVFHKPHGLQIAAMAANITPHPEQGIGQWTDDEIKVAITQGISRNGRRLQPVMPFYLYESISDVDLDALIAYLRSIPPQPPN